MISEETPQQPRDSRLGYRHSAETKRRISVALKGKPKSSEHCQKMRARLTGRKTPVLSEAGRALISAANRGKVVSEITRKKISEALSGPRNHFWRGGVTAKHLRVRASAAYRQWRTAVFERDGFNCVWCGAHGGRLNADHIKAFAAFPDLRFMIDNGRTLCEPCHRKTDTFAGNSKQKRT